MIMELKHWVALFVVIGLSSLGIVSAIIEDKSLSNCSKFTEARVVDFYRIRSRGYFVKYTYTVDSKLYEKTVSLPKIMKVEDIRVDDSIKVIYACSNPKHSEFLIE